MGKKGLSKKLKQLRRQSLGNLSLAGFTLIELLVAASILSIGIVFILRSFLTATSVLDSSKNRISAIELLEEKLMELEEQATISQGIKDIQESTEVALNNRQAVLTIETSLLELDENAEEQQSPEEGQQAQLEKVTVTLSWKEGNRAEDIIIQTYLPRQEEAPSS